MMPHVRLGGSCVFTLSTNCHQTQSTWFIHACFACSRTSNTSVKSALEIATEFSVGAAFSAGLVLCGMTHPTKVVGFLSPFYPAWDLSLPFVMVGAIAVSFFGFQTITGKLWACPPTLAKPVVCPAYSMPSPSAKIDAKLIAGGLLFGAGWGASGMCPGPAMVGLAHYSPQVGAYLAALAVGMFLEPTISKAVEKLTQKS